MPMNVCVCVSPGNVAEIQRLLSASVANKVKSIVFGQTPSDFAAAKADSAPIALLVESGAAHDALKDLCDDKGAASRRVKFIYSLTAGVDAYRLLDIEAEVSGIPIHNAQGCYSDILGEHVIYAMSYFNRSTWRLMDSHRQKKWDRFNMKELAGQKVGIFGYGSIGQACGKRAAALGMDVTGIRRTVPAGGVDEYGVHVKTDAATDQVLRESDFVVGVLPGTAATKHFFNKDVFSRMKPSAVFINIGRGATQCETDIVDAVKKGTIAGVALDVFEVEPLPESSPLWDLPADKALLSAHCADWTENLVAVSAKRFASIYEEYEAKGECSSAHRVDIHKGY